MTKRTMFDFIYKTIKGESIRFKAFNRENAIRYVKENITGHEMTIVQINKNLKRLK